MSHRKFKAQLGEDLWELVQGLRAPLHAVKVLTSLPSVRRQRASFRLELGDGRVLKGKCFESASQAERVEYLLQFLDRGHFPGVLARCRSAMLIEWVNGQPLMPARCPPELLRRCGALQGSLHSKPLPGDVGSRIWRGTDDWPLRLERYVRDLVGYGALEALEGKRVSELAATHAPGSVAVGLVHGDFCAENIIVQPPDRLTVIDNETVTIDAYDYDLGRTWYLWPMSPIEREAYHEGYNRYRSPSGFVTHLLFWVIVVLARSAEFRFRTGAGDWQMPVRQLRALLQDPLPEEVPLRSRLSIT